MINQIKYLCIKILKSGNIINPSFTKQIFQLKEINKTLWTKYKLNLSVFKVNQLSVGETSNW